MKLTNLLLPLLAALLMGGCGHCDKKACEQPYKAGHVVMIGLDGWGAYSVEKAEMPVVKQMMKEGAFTLKKRSVLPSSSAANWASMYMGAGPELHGYTDWGSQTPDLPSRVYGDTGMFPNLFALLRKAAPEADMACFYEWGGMRYVIDTTAFTTFAQTIPEAVEGDPRPVTTDVAVKYITEHKPLLINVVYDQPDGVGHRIGHDTPEYYAQLKVMDAEIGRLIAAVKEAGIYDDTIFVLTSDHGGINRGHGGKTMLEMETPFIIFGKGVKKGLEFTESMMQFDCAPTVAEIFGLELPQVWIGRSMSQVYE